MSRSGSCQSFQNLTSWPEGHIKTVQTHAGLYARPWPARRGNRTTEWDTSMSLPITLTSAHPRPPRPCHPCRGFRGGSPGLQAAAGFGEAAAGGLRVQPPAVHSVGVVQADGDLVPLTLRDAAVSRRMCRVPLHFFVLRKYFPRSQHRKTPCPLWLCWRKETGGKGIFLPACKRKPAGNPLLL